MQSDVCHLLQFTWHTTCFRFTTRLHSLGQITTCSCSSVMCLHLCRLTFNCVGSLPVMLPSNNNTYSTCHAYTALHICPVNVQPSISRQTANLYCVTQDSGTHSLRPTFQAAASGTVYASSWIPSLRMGLQLYFFVVFLAASKMSSTSNFRTLIATNATPAKVARVKANCKQNIPVSQCFDYLLCRTGMLTHACSVRINPSSSHDNPSGLLGNACCCIVDAVYTSQVGIDRYSRGESTMGVSNHAPS